MHGHRDLKSVRIFFFYEVNATPELKEILPVKVAGEGKETRELSVTWLFSARGAGGTSTNMLR